MQRFTLGFGWRGLSLVATVEEGAATAVPVPVFCFFPPPAPAIVPHHHSVHFVVKTKILSGAAPSSCQGSPCLPVIAVRHCKSGASARVLGFSRGLLMLQKVAAHKLTTGRAVSPALPILWLSLLRFALPLADPAPAWYSCAWSGSLPAWKNV